MVPLFLAVSYCFGILCTQAGAIERFSAFHNSFGGGGQVVLNGFPVFECTAAGMTRTTIWNPYLKKGNNELFILLTNVPVNGSRIEGELSIVNEKNESKKFIEYSIKSSNDGLFVTWFDDVLGLTNITMVAASSVTNGFDIKKSAWSTANGFSLAVNDGQLLLSIHFNVENFAVTRLPWEDSPTTISPSDALAITASANSIVESFRSGNLERCISGYSVRNHHIATAMGMDPVNVDEAQRKAFSKLLASPDKKLTVAEASQIVPFTGAKWKVARLVCRPLFRLQGSEATFVGEHFYAKVSGKWVCVD